MFANTCSENASHDRGGRIGVAAAGDHVLDAGPEVTRVSPAGVHAHRHRVQHEPGDSLAQPRASRKLSGAHASPDRPSRRVQALHQLRRIPILFETSERCDQAVRIRRQPSRCPVGLDRDGQCAGIGTRVNVRDPGRGRDEFVQLIPVPRQNAQHRGPHRGPVAGRSNAAATRVGAEPQLGATPQRRQPHARRQRRKPPPQSSRKVPGEQFLIATRRTHRRRRHDCVLGVVRNHAMTQQQAMPVRKSQESLGTLRRKSLIGQPNRVRHGRAQDASPHRLRHTCFGRGAQHASECMGATRVRFPCRHPSGTPSPSTPARTRPPRPRPPAESGA